MKFHDKYKQFYKEANEYKNDIIAKILYKTITSGKEKISQMDGVEILGDISKEDTLRISSELSDEDVDRPLILEFEISYKDDKFKLIIWADLHSLVIEAKGITNKNYFKSTVDELDIYKLIHREDVGKHMVELVKKLLNN